MDVLIVAARTEAWVADFFPGTSLLALPLAAKPLAEHHLDRCAREGAASVCILDADWDPALARRLGDGARWGLALRYARAPDAAAVAARAAAASRVVRGDELVWDGAPVRIDSLRAWFELNFKLIARPAECVLPGYWSQAGVHLGMNVQIRLRSEVRPPVLLDDNCRIDDGCRLDGAVIVGEGSIVDRGCRLRRVIVFPRTYVAQEIALEDKVVVGSRVIDPIAGASVDLAGDVLVAALDRARRREEGLLRRLVRALLRAGRAVARRGRGGRAHGG